MFTCYWVAVTTRRAGEDDGLAALVASKDVRGEQLFVWPGGACVLFSVRRGGSYNSRHIFFNDANYDGQKEGEKSRAGSFLIRSTFDTINLIGCKTIVDE